MIRIAPHKFLLALLAAASALPLDAAAQGAAPSRATDPPDAMTAQDREMLALAEQLADQSTQILASWITTQAISEDRLFARVYFPVP